MVTDDLINYIKSSLASGTDPEALKQELRGHGWANDDIDSAMVTAQMGRTAAHSESSIPNSGWHITKKEVFIALAAIIILGAAGAAAAYFVIPPKPEKVMSQAAANLLNTKSFDYSGNLVFDVSAPSGFFSLNNFVHGFPANTDQRIAGASDTKFDVDFTGSADLTDDKNPKSDVNLNFSYSLFNFGMEMRLLDQVYYLKFNNLPKLPDYDISQYSGTWIKIDPQDISKQYGVDLSLSAKQSTITDGQKQQILDMATKAHLFNSLTKLPDDKIDGQSMYHYAVDVDMNGLKDYFHEVERITNSTETTDSNLEGLAITNTEVWIGKNDRFIHKLMTQITDSSNASPTVPASGSVNISLSLNNYNQPSPITIPDVSKNVIDLIKNFTTNAQSQSRDTLRLSDVRQIQTALALYYNDYSKYPAVISSLTKTYLPTIPEAPTPADGLCTDKNNPLAYKQASGGKDYSLTFCLGNSTGGYDAGIRTASSSGIK